MGEIADMMLDGEMCQGCGEFLDDPQGFPGWCSGCYRAHQNAKQKHPADKKKKTKDQPKK